MTFIEVKEMFMKRFKSVKEIYRNESKKGICTTVILTCGAKGVIKLADGETDDFEKSILWAFAKATKETHLVKVSVNQDTLLMRMMKERANSPHNRYGFGVAIPQPLSIGYAMSMMDR